MIEQKRFAEIKTTIIPILKRHNVSKAGLFGSLVRGEMTAGSDIDILVELPDSKSLLDFVGLKLDLEEAVGYPVDLVEYSTIHPILKEQIMAEEVSIMKRNNRLFVQDILESIIKIEQYTKNITQYQFLQNSQIQDAVARRFEIIGEATKNLPRNLRLKYPDIPCYFNVNTNRVWEIIKQDLPGLKQKISHVLDELTV